MVEVVNGIDNRVMVTASCSVNKDEVKELSASGGFKGGAIFCARLEALRDRQCWVVDLCPDFPFKAGSTTYC